MERVEPLLRRLGRVLSLVVARNCALRRERRNRRHQRRQRQQQPGSRTKDKGQRTRKENASQQLSLIPTQSTSATRSRLDGLSDRPRRKGSRGASLGDVPLASGQARQQLTSSAACEEPEAGVSCRMSHSSARCQCKNAFAPRQLGARPACFPACARASQSSGGPGILALPCIHSC